MCIAPPESILPAIFAAFVPSSVTHGRHAPLGSLTIIYGGSRRDDVLTAKVSSDSRAIALALSHVCRTWRATALDIPLLWSLLSLVIPEDEAPTTTKRRLAAFCQLLDRTRPLSLSVSFIDDTQHSPEDKAHACRVADILSILETLSKRCERLYVRAPPRSVRLTLACITAPLLRTFHYSDSTCSSLVVSGAHLRVQRPYSALCVALTFLDTATALRKLRVSISPLMGGQDTSTRSLISVLPQFNRNSLKYLHLSCRSIGRHHWRRLRQLLCDGPLHSITLTDIESSTATPTIPPNEFLVRQIDLERLTLHFCQRVPDHPIDVALFSTLMMRKLRRLEVCYDVKHPPTILDLRPLLGKRSRYMNGGMAPAMMKLVLRDVMLSPSEMDDLLEPLAHLRDLRVVFTDGGQAVGSFRESLLGSLMRPPGSSSASMNRCPNLRRLVVINHLLKIDSDLGDYMRFRASDRLRHVYLGLPMQDSTDVEGLGYFHSIPNLRVTVVDAKQALLALEGDKSGPNW